MAYLYGSSVLYIEQATTLDWTSADGVSVSQPCVTPSKTAASEGVTHDKFVVSAVFAVGTIVLQN